jgi:hypothetical protein
MRFDGPFWRMNCQMFSWLLSSGERGGNGVQQRGGRPSIGHASIWKAVCKRALNQSRKASFEVRIAKIRGFLLMVCQPLVGRRIQHGHSRKAEHISRPGGRGIREQRVKRFT